MFPGVETFTPRSVPCAVALAAFMLIGKRARELHQGVAAARSRHWGANPGKGGGSTSASADTHMGFLMTMPPPPELGRSSLKRPSSLPAVPEGEAPGQPVARNGSSNSADALLGVSGLVSAVA